jgi:hypothetical protein
MAQTWTPRIIYRYYEKRVNESTLRFYGRFLGKVTRMNGIRISKNEGAAQDSVIKLNYIFTITNEAIIKTVFQLSSEKRNVVFDELMKKFSALKYS